jgi:hypothetical protein
MCVIRSFVGEFPEKEESSYTSISEQTFLDEDSKEVYKTVLKLN